MNNFIQKIILFLFNRRLNKQLKTVEREKRFVNYESARSVILLFESDYLEKNSEIKQLIQSFNNDGKKVMAWGYVQKKEISTAILPDFRILHQKDADFTGMPNDAFMRELEELNFDLLIDLSVNENKPLQYLALYANAACKVGTHNYPGMYDVVIDVQHIKEENQLNEVDTTAIQIYNHLFFYLKSIQTND
jgi:hypothetical protein